MKVLGKALYLLCMAFMLWFTLGFAEIACKNTFENPTYSKYNCFMIAMEVLENENVND